MSISQLDLTGQTVFHKVFGKGVVTVHEAREDQKTDIIHIDFSGTQKTFTYPTAFEKFLSVKDAQLSEKIGEDIATLNEIETQEKEARVKMALAETLSDLRRAEKILFTDTPRKARSRGYGRKNVAIKCNYNDGGKNERRIGFHGICSDPIIENNIMVEGRAWCTQDDCLCKQYHDGIISRRELEKMCGENGYVCYESQMLRDWRAMAGVYHSGEKKGEPMKLRNVQKNSLAVLTTRFPGSSEPERFVFAVFLVDEFREGDEQDAGFVSTKSKYKMSFSEDESRHLLFWNYYANSKNPETPAWGSGLARYLSDDVAVQILRDAVKVKKGSDEEELAEEFLEYFCKVNRIDSTLVRKPDGALVME